MVTGGPLLFGQFFQARRELESRINELNAQIRQGDNAIRETQQRIWAMEAHIKGYEPRLQETSENSAKLVTLKSQATLLIDDCGTFTAQIQAEQKEVEKRKDGFFRAARLASEIIGRAQSSGAALSKADYVKAVLLIVEIGLNDQALVTPLADIVKEVADHDNSEASVRGIKTDDHPDGLLADIQKKIEQAQGGRS